MAARLVCFTSLTLCAIGSVAVADDLSSGKDLAATIALNGQPCSQVVDVKRNGDSDYIATCKDGNRYHVFVNPQGRVIVQKQ